MGCVIYIHAGVLLFSDGIVDRDYEDADTPLHTHAHTHIYMYM